MTRGNLEIDGNAYATLNVEFGSSATASLVFAGEWAASTGGVASAPDARPLLVGGLLELGADLGERRFLMDYRGLERPEFSATARYGLLSTADNGDKAAPPGPGGRPTVGGLQPPEALPLVGTTAPSLALFLVGWADGTQIADGLSTASTDNAGTSARADAAAHARGNPADVLLTVDTVLPDVMADLVRLQNADLAMGPTYMVGTPPAAAHAPPRLDDQPDLGLPVQVVGIDAFPGERSLTPGRGVATRSLDMAAMQSGAVAVGDAAQATAQAQQSAVTDAAPALRQWLDGLVQQGLKGAR